ncbi:SDR family oxidoreductase [Rhodococcus qingshengii]|uniref:SDR family oxidoreductase n=1 Tax=Rhodococcus qingshengii TaxID=334542 RepID=UPI001ADFEAF2|nr:SDR family oxidoreductase [Rhodococcus qingshengii]MCQ4149684.1 SDR family oxidoreductase [Rhodococcus qingshengii]MCY4668948.1 SDR family oxidoreductase [Rhodococcus sp. (in: high G+C Gram-positive bacteria)]
MSEPNVFITGAAAGIGRETSLLFARNGYRVGAFDIDDAGLASLQAEIDGFGGSVVTGVLDVTYPAGWAQCLADFAGESGRLDILINNAGVLSSGRFEDISLAAHRRMVDINITGTLNGTHTAFPYLRDTVGAQVVNLCSASAIYGQPELATYGATKFAIRGLTEALDLEWAQHDIRVLALWPLFVQTAMVTGMDTGATRSLGIKLTATDVAQELWAATRGAGRMHKVHYPVGTQAKLFLSASRFSPAWLSRLMNKRVTST